MPTNRRFRVRSRVVPAVDLDEMAKFMVVHMHKPFLMRAFGDLWEDVAEAAWHAHGDELTREWIARHPGTRPPAWWAFDAPSGRPAAESQRSYLLRHGLLTRWETRSNGEYTDE
jgi:hypothetical protein